MALPSGNSFVKFGQPAFNSTAGQQFVPQTQATGNNRPNTTQRNPMQLSQTPTNQQFSSFYNQQAQSTNQPSFQGNQWAPGPQSNTRGPKPNTRGPQSGNNFNAPAGLQTGGFNTQAPPQQFNQSAQQFSGNRGQSSRPQNKRGKPQMHSNRPQEPRVPHGINTMPPPEFNLQQPQFQNQPQIYNSQPPATTPPAQIGALPKLQHPGQQQRGPNHRIDFSDYDANHFVKNDPQTGNTKLESDLKYIGMKRLRCHSHVNELAEEEKKSYKAKKFRIGSIPENPPCAEDCN